MEALRKKDRQDETQFTAKIGGKTSLGKGQTGWNPETQFAAKIGGKTSLGRS